MSQLEEQTEENEMKEISDIGIRTLLIQNHGEKAVEYAIASSAQILAAQMTDALFGINEDEKYERLKNISSAIYVYSKALLEAHDVDENKFNESIDNVHAGIMEVLLNTENKTV